MAELRHFRAQAREHVQIIKTPETTWQNQCRSSGEAQNELDLAAAKIAVELAERDPRQHRRIDRYGEFAPLRQLDRDDIIGAEPQRDEMGRKPLGAAIIFA